MRMHDGRIELVGLDRALAADHHVGHHHQPVDPRVERAQPVRQLLRQHRDHAPREVHRGRAVLRLGIESRRRPSRSGRRRRSRRSGAMPLAAADRLAIDRVVEVARVLAVDRDQRHVAQVDAAAQSRGCTRVRQRFGQFEQQPPENSCGTANLRTAISISMPGSSTRAEHLDDAADRLHIALRLLDDLDHDHLAGLRPPAWPPGGTRMSCWMRWSSGTTIVTPRSLSRRPTSLLVRRSMTSTISPSGRPRRSVPPTRASTRSPCSTLLISCSGRKRSCPPSSRIRKPKPSRWPCTWPDDQIGARRDEQQAGLAVTHDAPGALELAEFASRARRATRPRACMRSASSSRRQRRARLGQCLQYGVRLDRVGLGIQWKFQRS